MKKMQKGFTLIELLVVIAIIGILSSVVITSMSSARVKAKTAAFKAEVSGVLPAMILLCDSPVSGDEITTTTVPPLGTYAVSGSVAAPVVVTDGECADDGTFAVAFTATNGADSASDVATCTQAGCTFN